jgi:hypothetical protein
VCAIVRRYDEERLNSALQVKPRPGKERMLNTGELARFEVFNITA